MQFSSFLIDSLSQLNIDQLNRKAEILKELCLNIDPYKPFDEGTQEILTQLGIKDLDDPFRVTNQLILRMENVLEEIENRKNSPKVLH